MIFALDVGNTNIVFGCIENGSIAFEGRLETDREKTELEYAAVIKSILDIKGIDTKNITDCIISSVVPPINSALGGAMRLLFGKAPYFADVNSKHGLIIDTDRPESLGHDLIVAAAAALAEYKPPIIIFDLGTATTVSVIDKNSHYIGGAITAGLRLSQQALSANASQLPGISLEPPVSVIGKNTQDAMKSGLMIGCAAMMDGMAERIERELGEKAVVIATGGFAPMISALCTHTIHCDKDLILKGLWIIYSRSCEK